MSILLIGAMGQLGQELNRKGAAGGCDIIPLDLPVFNITNKFEVAKKVRKDNVSIVINAAAYTDVDKAESEPGIAFKVNRDGPAYLASACSEVGVPLIHISTDYVFDGNKKRPYVETDPVLPLGVYGKSKAAGELEVRRRLKENIILRTAWLYGVEGQNFVKTMLRLGKEKKVLKVVNDQYGCPTYAADLADAILTIIKRYRKNQLLRWGTYHFCGRGTTTWYNFALKIFDFAREKVKLSVETVVPIKTEEYPTPAKRPVNSSLDCSQITETFDVSLSSWEESLARMLEKIL
jgi:dTDP-4-dehydrorhamnose reductase